MDIRTVVADDEEPARNELCFLLEPLDEVDVIGQAADGIEALRLIKTLKPDLVLLDIQMPGLTGFEVARELLVQEIDAQVVFVTAYDEYAIEAFNVNAVDYLLKPVEPKRLMQTVQRVQRQLSQNHAAARRHEMQPRSLQKDELERLLKYVENRKSKRERLAIKVEDRFLLVQSDDIIYASLADNVITIVTESLTGTSNYRRLDELHSHLDPDVFWRVHRSHLVNINKIKEIEPWFSRNYILKMKDGKRTKIPVSRAQTKRLREYLSL